LIRQILIHQYAGSTPKKVLQDLQINNQVDSTGELGDKVNKREDRIV